MPWSSRNTTPHYCGVVIDHRRHDAHLEARSNLRHTIPFASDLVDQRFDLHGERCLLVELVLGLANVLADARPELHLFVVPQSIITRPWAISRHFFSKRTVSFARTWPRYATEKSNDASRFQVDRSVSVKALEERRNATAISLRRSARRPCTRASTLYSFWQAAQLYLIFNYLQALCPLPSALCVSSNHKRVV